MSKINIGKSGCMIISPIQFKLHGKNFALKSRGELFGAINYGKIDPYRPIAILTHDSMYYSEANVGYIRGVSEEDESGNMNIHLYPSDKESYKHFIPINTQDIVAWCYLTY